MLSIEMGKVIIGQKQLVENLLIGLLANGHILLEGVPGLAKTLAISTSVKGDRCEVQPYTVHPGPSSCRSYRYNDLFPEVRVNSRCTSGPIFANFVLAD